MGLAPAQEQLADVIYEVSLLLLLVFPMMSLPVEKAQLKTGAHSQVSNHNAQYS